MRLDVFFGASSMTTADTHGRVVIVVDVLRASTTIAVALANGARSVIPFDSAEEAIKRSKSFERGEYKLAGERRNLMIPGFDLGNSPRDFVREQVEGKTILFSTTNGTAALVSIQGAHEVLVGSFVNFSAVLAMTRAAARGGIDITIVAVGSEKHFSLEDAACAGRFVRAISKRFASFEINDGSKAALLIYRKYAANLSALFGDATHGRALVEAGFAEDLAFCSAVDSFPVVPVYQDRQLTKLGPKRAR